MRRIRCRLFGHHNIWTLHPLAPSDRTEFVVVCLRCRGWSDTRSLAAADPDEATS